VTGARRHTVPCGTREGGEGRATQGERSRDKVGDGDERGNGQERASDEAGRGTKERKERQTTTGETRTQGAGSACTCTRRRRSGTSRTSRRSPFLPRRGKTYKPAAQRS
jgi:hypothetical protein